MNLSILPVCKSLLSFLSQTHASFIAALLEIDCFLPAVHHCFFIYHERVTLISGRGLKIFRALLAPSHSICFRRLCIACIVSKAGPSLEEISEHQVSCGMAHSARAIYSLFFIHGITSAKRTREVRPAVLRREISAQLIMYSLDTCVRYSTCIILISERLHGGPEFSGNYLIDYIIIT